uniref:Ig-like domain-containing protein n=1 Tax=Cyclopterus lumpus TaxID=8103 RepID=A0A8C2WQW8_CYCLU
PIRCAGEVFSNLIQTAEVPQQVSLTLVELGGNVTLWCPVFREGYFYWYKQTLGHMIQTVATVTFTGQKLSLQLNNTRFKVTGGKTQYSLTIRNITKEDEATYFCLIGTAYGQSFVNVTFLAVKGKTHILLADPLTESVQPGDSVTLQCSLVSRNKEDRVQCPGEHSVHWFRSGSGESHPGFIHTHSDAQEERSCDFSLSKTIHNSSDTGTYYCAVATCGEILFGEGTQVDTRSKLEPVVIGLGVLLACCVTAIVLLIFYVNRRRVCEHCKGSPYLITMYYYYRYFSYSYNLQDADRDAVNYAALNFAKRKVPRVKKRESPAECVYSAVRADYQTQRHL